MGYITLPVLWYDRPKNWPHWHPMNDWQRGYLSGVEAVEAALRPGCGIGPNWAELRRPRHRFAPRQNWNIATHPFQFRKYKALDWWRFHEIGVSRFMKVRYHLRFLYQLPLSNISTTLATNQKWPLCTLHCLYQNYARSNQKIWPNFRK